LGQVLISLIGVGSRFRRGLAHNTRDHGFEHPIRWSDRVRVWMDEDTDDKGWSPVGMCIGRDKDFFLVKFDLRYARAPTRYVIYDPRANRDRPLPVAPAEVSGSAAEEEVPATGGTLSEPGISGAAGGEVEMEMEQTEDGAAPAPVSSPSGQDGTLESAPGGSVAV